MRVALTVDEQFPVYTIDAEDGSEGIPVEVPQSFVSRYTEARAKWDAVQRELHEVYEVEKFYPDFPTS